MGLLRFMALLSQFAEHSIRDNPDVKHFVSLWPLGNPGVSEAFRTLHAWVTDDENIAVIKASMSMNDSHAVLGMPGFKPVQTRASS